jgi:hypothetical protein
VPAQSWLYTCAVPVSVQRANAHLPSIGQDLVPDKTVLILVVYSSTHSIDLRRVFLRCVNISTRIHSVSCPRLYGGLYGQNLPYKFKNSYGDFRNRDFDVLCGSYCGLHGHHRTDTLVHRLASCPSLDEAWDWMQRTLEWAGLAYTCRSRLALMTRIALLDGTVGQGKINA